MNEELILVEQKQVLINERQYYIRLRYAWQSKMKAVQGLLEKGILKDRTEAEKPILEELASMEAWIAEYNEQITEIEAAIKAETAKAPAHENGRAIKVKEQS